MSRRFPSQESPPKLLMTREDASARLKAQIQKGEELAARPAMNSEEEIKAFGAKQTRWSEYNSEMLARMFDNGRYQRGYDAGGHEFVFIDPRPFMAYSFQGHVEAAFEFVRGKVEYLTSLEERLPVMNLKAEEAELNSGSAPVPPATVQRTYNQHFHGSVGNVAAGSHDFQQEAILNQQSFTVDLSQLARELPVLRQALVLEASEPEHYIAIGAVREAEIEAEKKDTPKMIQSLSKAGVWAFDVATKIGTAVAAEAIKHSIGGAG